MVKEEGSITILQEVFVERCEDFVSRIIDVHTWTMFLLLVRLPKTKSEYSN